MQFGSRCDMFFEEIGFGFCKDGMSFTIYFFGFFMDLAIFAPGER